MHVIISRVLFYRRIMSEKFGANVPFSMGKLMSLWHVATNAEHVSFMVPEHFSQIIHHIFHLLVVTFLLRALPSPFSLCAHYRFVAKDSHG